MKKIINNKISNLIKVLVAVLALFLFNIDARAEVTFSQDFNYTGNIQEFVVPYSGQYKIEVWGAQGGATDVVHNNFGAYSVGSIQLIHGNKIYIGVGGQGGSLVGQLGTIPGGFNGGGSGKVDGTDQVYNSGGGATHMALGINRGELKNYDSYRNELLIVAGGGGSSGRVNQLSYNHYQGSAAAGGISSSDTAFWHDWMVLNDHHFALGGKATQTSGNAFGQGSSGGHSGGGGGYYGGGHGGTGDSISAGGSSYIGNPDLTDKHMTCYACTTSDEESTKTTATTLHSATPKSDQTKEGSGYAKVTLLDAYAYLNGLIANKGTIEETFEPNLFEYTWIIPKGVSELTDEDITATPNNPESTVIIPENVPFTQDGDTFEIIVIDDNTDRNTYTLRMQRYVSNDGRLASITSDKGKLSETFDPDKKDYTLEIFEDADSVILDATAFEQDNQGITGLGEITLTDYEQDTQITSTAEDGTIEVYNIHIIKDMYLKNIEIEGLGELDCGDEQCYLNPSFDPSEENYKINVPYEYDKLNVTYVPSHEGLMVGIRVNNKNYSRNQILSNIKTTIKFNVYRNDNSIIKTYTVVLKREKEDEGALKTLKVNKGHLVENFKGNKYNYTWIIPKGTTTLTNNDVVAKLANSKSLLDIPSSAQYTQDGDKYNINIVYPNVEEFSYTGSIQEYIVPFTGLYKLETWGAQGGARDVVHNNFGAYSVGTIELEEGNSLYIGVGGQGGSSVGQIGTIPGGFNGGGSGEVSATDQLYNSGGGATHIALEINRGELKYYASSPDELLIVAGGGGSSGRVNNVKFNHYQGSAAAGGISSSDTAFWHDWMVLNDHHFVLGGRATQTSGNAFGQGSSGMSGGGGGYYGGGHGGTGDSMSSGGSSYIGNPNLTDKHMTCYACTTSNEESTKTIATTLHSATPKSDQTKEGNGFAKITSLNNEEGTLTKTYTLTLQMEISDDARLATLTSDKGIFTEEFDKDKDEYVLEMYHKETSVTFDATPFEQDATVIDGLGEIDLPTDETEHTITVQAEDGTIKIYTVIIRRNMYIEDLGLYGLDDLYCKSYECHMTPEFRPEIIDYEYRVPLDYNILDAYYEPASSEHRSEMTINGEPYVDGYTLPYTGITVVQVNVYNDSDEIVKTYTMNVIKEYKHTEEFDYTGEVEPYIAPRTGKYLVEIWGAQGGNANSAWIGGYGAYSVGSIDIEKSDKLSVVVGGHGNSNDASTTTGATGGYNGGGDSGYLANAGEVRTASGGGASHVAKSNNSYNVLSSYTDAATANNYVYIVAGGGGGAWYHNNVNLSPWGNGGSGGGYLGNKGQAIGAYQEPYVAGGGGTQSAGGSSGTNGKTGLFGQGASPNTTDYSSGGGGGYYGGGSAAAAGAGGGSGYIANSELLAYEDIEKHMTCYNCQTSDVSSTKTLTTTCHDQNPIADCAKEGNGYAKISLLETETMLASLDVDSVNIVESFDKFRTEYTWIIPKGVDEFTSDNVIVELLHPEKAHIEWPSEPVHFTQNGDKFTFKVVADNGEEDTYILTMIREKSSENRLKTLECDKGVFTPEFNPDTNSYVLEIYEYLDEVTLTGEPMSEYSNVVGLGTIDMEEDIVEHEIIVTAEDGSINIYNVTIKKDAYLLYLGLNGLDSVPCVEDECTLVPPFEPSSNEYSIKVPYEYETLDVYYLTSTPEHSVKIKVNDSEVSNYSLPEGNTLVTIELYNKNNILVNTYTMNVNRAKGNYATLDNLEVSTGDLNISFDRETTEYTWIIPFDVSNNLEKYLTYSTTDPGATAELIPNTINYTGDGQTFDIKVTAEDGVTTKTYTITLQQDIIEDIEVDENMFITVGETKNLYINGLPDGCVGKYLYEVDQSAIIYVYDNGDVYGIFPGEADITISVKNHPEITPKVVHVTVVSDKITSSILDVLDKDLARIIIGEEPGVNISDFLDKLDNPREYLEVYDKDDNLISSDDYENTYVKTGIKVKLVIEGNLHDEAIIIIRGDINEDGNVNVIDKSIISEHLLRLNNIEGYRTYAADIDSNDSINVVDKSKISEYLLRLIDSLNE